MIRGGHTHAGTAELEKLGPETASELGISVGHQVFRDTVEAYDLIKEQFR
jgi:hypothetical protein